MAAAGVDRRAMTGLSLGHLAADFAQGAVPALLVFLKPILHLSYTQTAAVVLVATATSSLAQPFFGHGHSKSYGNSLLSLVLFAGVAGTLCAGPLADRYGRRLMLVASLLLTPGLILVFVLVGGTVGAIAVCAAGGAIVSTFGVTVVMSQEYLPSRIAMASGLSVGLATGLGGLAAVVLGAVADAVDLRTALVVTALGPALGVAVALFLPGDRALYRTRCVAAES